MTCRAGAGSRIETDCSAFRARTRSRLPVRGIDTHSRRLTGTPILISGVRKGRAHAVEHGQAARSAPEDYDNASRSMFQNGQYSLVAMKGQPRTRSITCTRRRPIARLPTEKGLCLDL